MEINICINVTKLIYVLKKAALYLAGSAACIMILKSIADWLRVV